MKIRKAKEGDLFVIEDVKPISWKQTIGNLPLKLYSPRKINYFFKKSKDTQIYLGLEYFKGLHKYRLTLVPENLVDKDGKQSEYKVTQEQLTYQLEILSKINTQYITNHKFPYDIISVLCYLQFLGNSGDRRLKLLEELKQLCGKKL